MLLAPLLLFALLPSPPAAAQQAQVPPLSPALLCHLDKEELDYPTYSLFQFYEHEYDPDPSMNGYPFHPPGMTVEFTADSWVWDLRIEIHDLQLAQPVLSEFLTALRIAPTRKATRRSFGRQPKRFGSFYPEYMVEGEVPERAAEFWASWDPETGTRLERLEIQVGDPTSEIAAYCASYPYPPPSLEHDRWDAVRLAFDDPAYLHLLFTLDDLNFLDWEILTTHYGFDLDVERGEVYGHGLRFAVDSAITEVQLDWREGWEERALAGLERLEGGGDTWLGGGYGVEVSPQQGDREGRAGAERWYLIRGPWGSAHPFDDQHVLGHYMQPPYCRSGDCVDGRGIFVWSNGCVFDGRFVDGEPRDGWYRDDEVILEAIGGWQEIQAERDRARAEAQAIADAEYVAYNTALVEEMLREQERESREASYASSSAALGPHERLYEQFTAMDALFTVVISIYEDQLRIISLAVTDSAAFREEAQWAHSITEGGLEKVETIDGQIDEVRSILAGAPSDCDPLLALFDELDGELYKLSDAVRAPRELALSGYSEEVFDVVAARQQDALAVFSRFQNGFGSAASQCSLLE